MPIRYTRPITVSYRGNVTLTFNSVDWAGNTEYGVAPTITRSFTVNAM